MALTLTSINIGKEMGESPLMHRRKQNVFTDMKLIKKWKKEGDMGILEFAAMIAVLAFNRLLRFIYICFYFYFTPMASVLLVELGFFRQYVK